MKNRKSYSRKSLAGSALAEVPFQLLPHSQPDTALLDKRLTWESQISKSLRKKVPEIIVVIFDMHGNSRQPSTADTERNLSITLESLAVQSFAPSRVVLWLGSMSQSGTLAESLVKKMCDSEGMALSILDRDTIAFDELHTRFTPESYLMLLDIGSILHPSAFFLLSKELRNREHPADVIYFNETVLSDDYRKIKAFQRKSNWSPLSALSFDIFGSGLIVKVQTSSACIAQQEGDLVPIWSWLVALNLERVRGNSRRLPLALLSTTEQSKQKRVDSVSGLIGCLEQLVKRSGQDQGLSIEVLTPAEKSLFPALDIVFSRKNISSIQVIVPFRDEIEVTVRCLKSIYRQSCIADLEIVLVDNCSDGQALERLEMDLADLNHEVVTANGTLPRKIMLKSLEEPFNYARLNNYGATFSDSEFILFVNNDTELIGEHAISRLVDAVSHKVVGVGGVLFYPDGKIQSAGINLSGVRPANVCQLDQYAMQFREVAALSLAFALVTRKAYKQAGGLDEEICPNGYGDALFFFKLRKLGYHIALNPSSQICHYESRSRGSMVEDFELYQLDHQGLVVAPYFDDFRAPLQPSLIYYGEQGRTPGERVGTLVDRLGFLRRFFESGFRLLDLLRR